MLRAEGNHYPHGRDPCYNGGMRYAILLAALFGVLIVAGCQNAMTDSWKGEKGDHNTDPTKLPPSLVSFQEVPYRLVGVIGERVQRRDQ